MSPPPAIKHDDYQRQIVEAAKILHWDHLHVRKSVGRGAQHVTTTNIKGWPDLWLWHRTHGFLAIEVKVGRDTASPEQIAVLASLAAAGARTLVAYPKDWDAVVAALQGKDHPPSPR